MKPSNKPPRSRPPFKRNTSKSRSKKKQSPQTKLLKRWKLLLGLVVVYSAVQFSNTGSVSWPGELYRSVIGSLGEYAERPEAGWRKAGDKLEEMGAAKEGQPVPDFDLVGRVVRVADGDTVSVLSRGNKQTKVRLFGIDTPERDQAHGSQAQRALSKLVADKNVGVVTVEIDNYGRTVGTLYLGDTNINAEMVASGNAWWYRHYAPNDRRLANAEREAKQRSLGLWSGDNPIPPWDWRRGKR